MTRHPQFKLLTIGDLSKLFQRSECWIRQQIKSGDLPCLRMGNSIRFEPAQVEAYLKDRRLNAY